jgi:hypothetical protein
MQQPPLLPQPRPVAAHSSVVPGQPQQTTQLQQFSLQPMPAQQQLLAQPPFQVSCKSSDQGFISRQPEAMCPTLFLVNSQVQCQLVWTDFGTWLGILSHATVFNQTLYFVRTLRGSLGLELSGPYWLPPYIPSSLNQMTMSWSATRRHGSTRGGHGISTTGLTTS